VIERFKKNRVFRFLASLRMAVILMVALAVIVSVGTVIESRYNAQIAGILVYKSGWFGALMSLLWVNIFFSTLMRLPFKAHHTGFVVTHLGILMLLAGGMITGSYGIDGQLRVVEGQASNIVGLPELSLKVASAKANTLQSYHVKRSLEPKAGEDLGLSELQGKTGIIVEKYLPFVIREQGYADRAGDDGAPAINFTLESSMFGSTGEWLHAKDRPEGQIGPALLRLIVDDGKTVPVKNKSRSAQKAAPKSDRRVASAGSVLVVRDASGAELGQFTLAELKKSPRAVKGFKIELIKQFEQASVVENRLVERGEKGANPALELKISGNGKTLREVAFAKYPDFSMGGSADIGIHLEYRVAGTTGQSEGAMPGGHPAVGAETRHNHPDMAETAGSGVASSDNRIEFRVSAAELKKTGNEPLPIKVVLYKNGKQFFERLVNRGETIETPWMGMKIKLDSVMRNAVAVDQVRPAQMRPRSQLAESALLVRHSSEDPSAAVWVVEGDFKTVGSGDNSYEVFYGMETVDLPFSIELDKFEKVDYPGTETPMSFQSTVRVDGKGDSILISMNEPLKMQGFTLYQSSYEMGPGMPTASIFSVNRDPGRGVKYLGSLVLCLGIAIFAIMRSRWYTGYRQRRFMKTQMAVLLISIFSVLGAPSATWAETAGMPATDPHAGHNHAPGEGDHAPAMLTAGQAKERFLALGKKIDSGLIAELPIQSHGRLKPFDTYTREAVLYLTGKFRFSGLDSVQLYLGLMISEAAEDFEVVNLRDPKLRVQLGFPSNQRHASLRALASSPLESLARPALARAEQDSKSLQPEEKSLVEAMQQVWLARSIISGSHLMQGLQPNGASNAASATIVEKLQQYFRALPENDPGVAGLAADAIAAARAQPFPELVKRNLNKMGLEVWYNKAHLFFWVAVAYFLIGLTLLFPVTRRRVTKNWVLAAAALPFLVHASGFAIRVVITGFAPVTNMYGTMVWVAFGVVLFGTMLYLLYKHDVIYGIIMVGAALTLFLTENLPLVLSPDMDPIVAVLRSNFWLSTHVLTITISYAGFTIAMLLGNIAIFRRIFSAFSNKSGSQERDEKFYKEYSHLTYRVIQLGVFFLTAGIILGGVWADYSWGRFWGWDPKETWSLIALLGYLAILHARHVGWLRGFGILAASPVAYLLVVMAWYGVNFILAAGLHSYGFSSGGAAAVGGFVLVQLMLLSVAGVLHNMKTRQQIGKAGV